MLLQTIILCFHPSKSDQCLSFDISDFEKLKSDIEDSKTSFVELKKQAVDSIEQLREDWRTPAGVEFFSNLDSDWADCVNKYIATMDAFTDVMNSVIETFKMAQEEAENVSLVPFYSGYSI